MNEDDLSRQLASVTKELAIAAGMSDEYLRARARLYSDSQKQPSDFDLSIESAVASLILKRRVDNTGATKILKKLDDIEVREQADKVPDLEDQIRKLGEDVESMQRDLLRERRATSEYAIRNLKSLNDLYLAFQEFQPGVHNAFVDRLRTHLGGDEIFKRIDELFTNIPPREDYALEQSIVDQMCISVYNVTSLLEEENERISRASGKLSKKAVTQRATIENLTGQIKDSQEALSGILENQRKRLANYEKALTPLLKNYEGRFKSTDKDDRLFECIGFLVDDLSQKAEEIKKAAEQRKSFEDESKEITRTSRSEIDGYKSDIKIYQERVRELETKIDALYRESESELDDMRKTVEEARTEMERAVGDRDAAKKQLELYEKNLDTRVENEVEGRTADLESKISELKRRVEAAEYALAKTARDFGDCGKSVVPQHVVAEDIYTRLIEHTDDLVLKSKYLGNRGAVRLAAGKVAEGKSDLQKSYDLNPTDEVKSILDSLSLKSSQR